MEVITVPDGRSAFEKMGQIRPDLVLADVYMPEIGGLELCRSIKQDERFAKTPVVLLISSFEPFDEAEARRAGADDVVTKPFQSIRQLVSRVGSLLNKTDEESEMTHQYSTLGISEPEPVAPAPIEPRASEPYSNLNNRETEPAAFAPVESQPSEPDAGEPQLSEPHVTVMVEAPTMEHLEPAEPAGVSCSTDIELQTADTMRLERIVDEPIEEPAREVNVGMEDTIEVEPVAAVSNDEYVQVQPESETVQIEYRETSEPTAQHQPPPPMKFDDAVLDLEDELLGEPQMAGDDVFLDLDFADAAPVEVVEARVAEEAPAPIAFERSARLDEAVEIDHAPVIDEPPAVVTAEEPSTFEISAQEPVSETVAAPPPAPLTTSEVEGLSPEAIDAIARRMVEQMSDKVIREIAWEVVPELSELLIKRKLEEQK